jgi:hypothetical protein
MRHELLGYLLVYRLYGRRVLFSPCIEGQRVSMGSEIIIVSGLPRSGTSLMMQMLDRGGLEVVTDHIRSADTDNPRGYFEFEPVKKTKHDATWLPSARGKVVKMVSQLLYDLPPSEAYRIIFMERDLDEVLVSQEKMLIRLGRTPAPRAQMKQAYVLHLERLREWLPSQSNMTVMSIRYDKLIERSREHSSQVSRFVGNGLDVEAMVGVIDPALYRNRGSELLSEQIHQHPAGRSFQDAKVGLGPVAVTEPRG